MTNINFKEIAVTHSETLLPKRNVTIDIMKGIAILCVILGHIENIPNINHWIFSFHMPLFFLIAGYFHKRPYGKDSFHKDFKRLITPYLFTVGILLFYSCIVNFILKYDPEQVSLTFWAIIFPTGADFAHFVIVWFLPALFWTRMLFGSLLRLFKGNQVYTIVISLAVGGLCTYLKWHIIELPFAFLAGMSALVFYSIGSIFQQITLMYKIPWYVFLLLIMVWGCEYHNCYIGMRRCYYYHYLLSIVCAIGGTLFIYIVSSKIEKVPWANRFFEWFGVNSLVVLSVHSIEFFLPIPYNMINNFIVIFIIKILFCSAFTLIFYKTKWTRYIYSLKKSDKYIV